MSCPDDNTLTALFARTLPESEASILDEHVAACEACRDLLGNLAMMFAATVETSAPITDRDALPERATAAHPGIAVGTTVGRFVVLSHLGAGSMGVVFAAYDPKLDRKVALKFLSEPTGDLVRDSFLEARLVREAQAIARVSHPNVICVYEVGTFEGRVFLAIEFVEGTTLTEWLGMRRRRWEEILAVFLEAGTGLAAAHAAGIVHRDFKPDNVVVSRTDQAKVVDFGLARAAATPTEPQVNGTSVVPLSAEVQTRTGAILGTPAYMSPEQWDGRVASSKSDQFSYCVALYEALFGVRPGPLDSKGSGPVAVGAGDSGRGAPSWIRRALVRGLHPRPDERYPAMDVLLDVLRSKPRKIARRRIVAASILLALALAGVVGLEIRARSAARALLCRGAEQSLQGVWDGGRRGAILAAFERTGRPFAAHASKRVAEVFDGYARDWVAMNRDACEATRIRGEQSEAVLDLRMRCLNRRLLGMGALSEAFAQVEGDAIESAVLAADRLPAVSDCTASRARAQQDRGGAVGRPPSDRAIAESLARASALQETRKYAEAESLARASLEQARARGDGAMEAEALLSLGNFALFSQENRRAEPLLFEALTTAERSGDDSIAAKAGMRLAFAIGHERAEESEKWLSLASVSIERLGGDDALRAEWAGSHGWILVEGGKYREAVEEYRRELRLEERRSSDSLGVALSLSRLGGGLLAAGELAEAQACLERGLAIYERELGQDHPRVGIQLDNLGRLAINRARYDEGRAFLERAVAVVGTPAGMNVQHHSGLIHALAMLGRYDEARAPLATALAIVRANPGLNPSIVAELYTTAGLLERLAKRYDEAERHYEAALALYPASAGASAGKSEALIGLGRVHLERGHGAKALPLVEAVLAFHEKSNGSPVDLAEARFAMAQALWETNRDRPRAVSLLHEARDFYRQNPSHEPEVREIQEWFERNGPPLDPPP